MTQFVQLHMLVSYPPANPNRDDAGKPKTAMMGGANRLRISSQSLKRAWRTSEVFKNAMDEFLGKGTRSLAAYVVDALGDGFDQQLAANVGVTVHNVFTKKKAEVFRTEKKKKKTDQSTDTEATTVSTDAEGQRVFVGAEEMRKVDELVAWVKANKSMPSEEQFMGLLLTRQKSADVAMFGRMLANATDFNMEAAVQVANAITVHAVTLEDDFFTAVDDLNTRGSAFMGETPFAAGLFYLYLCVDSDLLLENLQGDQALANQALQALLEAAATVAPSGMQNRFGNRVRASYIRAERGSQQPRSLSVAFLKPVHGQDMLTTAIKALEKTADDMDKAYGDCVEAKASMQVGGDGSLAELKSFVAGAYHG